MIFNIIVCHSKLACGDESATYEEQSEKILYFYPPNIPVSEQLATIGCLESLVTFSSKFSFDPVEYVLMKNTLWGFLECEKGLWIYMSFKISPPDGLHNFSKKHTFYQNVPSGIDFKDAILKFYRFYSFFYGSVNVNLFDCGNGWNIICKVKEMRKKIRKLLNFRAQESRDLDYLNDQIEMAAMDAEKGDQEDISGDKDQNEPEKQLNIYSSRSIQDVLDSIASINNEVNALTVELTSMLNDKTYSCDIARQQWQSLAQWYLQTGELAGSPSLFHAHAGLQIGSVPARSISSLSRLKEYLYAQRATIEGNHAYIVWRTFVTSINYVDYLFFCATIRLNSNLEWSDDMDKYRRGDVTASV